MSAHLPAVRLSRGTQFIAAMMAVAMWFGMPGKAFQATAAESPSVLSGGQDAEHSYLPLIETHLQQLTTKGLDVYGPKQTGMWMAVIDTRTGRHPDFEQSLLLRCLRGPGGSVLRRIP
jgi:hypothetical protein